MTIGFFEKALCAAILSTLAAQQIGHAEEPDSGGAAAPTLFAYENSFRARVHDALIGVSEVPYDVPVELTPVDPSAWEQASLNSTVTLRVVHNVIVGQYAYAYAGTSIDAKVTRIREGKPGTRRGRMEPRVMEVTVPWVIPTTPPGSLKLALESTPRNRWRRVANRLLISPFTAIHVIVILPAEGVLLLIFCSNGCDL
jgi:hypothetical protein